MKKKPDALVLLAIVFGLGVLVSSLTHGGNEPDYQQYADSAGIVISHSQQ
ncbi:MAG: hypothetical protein MI751_03415 [Pseudomonadales bacterium]|nr:hypothetical protein [Alcanivorax sp. MD8A]MCG8437112.1 hypothetical protein [Pseudomonadales bacterium]|tara:strand:+ start:1831 stop:1980 length:150 start_codon:yes stop_codon:yes gene_type:complete